MSRIVVHPYKNVAKDDVLFVVSTPLSIYEVRSNMEGGLTALKPQEGDILPESEQFGCMIAEGENIPYGQPLILATPITQHQVKL